jgi:threonylcarbamoyladenosine tRNA methylthiotransferase CDKAL1
MYLELLLTLRATMDDIEDLALGGSISTIGSRSSASISQVLPRRVAAPPKATKGDDESSASAFDVKDDMTKGVPGTGKIFVKTYGCSHNISDSEYMAGMLESYGYSLTEKREEADLCLVNSCTVKDPSQAQFMHLVNKAKGEGQPVVVAGCVPQGDRKIPGLADVSVVGIQQIDRVVEVVEQSLQGHTVKLLAKKDLPRLDLPKVRKNKLVEIIPLSTGCLGSCTYCKTKHARGALGSYSLDALLSRVENVSKEGMVAEIWMTSEDTGAYGRDIGTSIAELLERTVALLPDHVMLRVGMTNPPFILEHLDAISKALNHPRVFSFLHIPVQAGSNAVLDKMNREYTVEEFRRVVDHLIKEVPGVTIMTDIICGFPTETEAMFQETLDLIEHYKLAYVNISQFYPRPGTPAARMKRIDTKVVKDRSRRMTALFESFKPHTHLIGTRERVWFDTEVSDDGRSVGHTKAYVKVLVTLDPELPGTSHEVEVTAAFRFHVEGRIVHGTRGGKAIAEREEMAAAHQAAVVTNNVSASASTVARKEKEKEIETNSEVEKENIAAVVETKAKAIAAKSSLLWNQMLDLLYAHLPHSLSLNQSIPFFITTTQMIATRRSERKNKEDVNEGSKKTKERKSWLIPCRFSITYTVTWSGVKEVWENITGASYNMKSNNVVTMPSDTKKNNSASKSKNNRQGVKSSARASHVHKGIYEDGFLRATASFLCASGVAMLIQAALRRREKSQ